MNLTAVILVSLALALDAFAASVASGVAIRNLRIRHAFTIAVWFGTFQGVMPLVGWLGGLRLKRIIEGVDHWVIFGLLLFVGAKMIVESFQIDRMADEKDPLSRRVLFALSVATSLDAFAVGISLAVLHVSIMCPALVIGLVTFAMSFAGVYIGDRFGHFFERRVEAVAGVILIGIGINTLLHHLC